ncbi:MAG: PfkB family carbohydrate kinase [Coprobacillaceae bacterium]
MKCLSMGETLLRYATDKGKRMQELSFHVHVGGSETNIATSLANFGYESELFSKISDNDLGTGIMKFLHSHQVNTDKVIRSKERVGSYYLEIGSGNRTSKVIYDRANSAMTTLSKEEIDVARLCKGIDIFIVSGITLALSREIQDIVIAIMKYCKEHDISVVYDSNYRAKLWSQKEAGNALREVLPYVDVLSAGHLDAKYLLNMDIQTGEHEEVLLDCYQKIKEQYPNIKYIISTKRDIISSSINELQGYLYDGEKITTSNLYGIDDIVDRVGAGDAFMSGAIHGILQKNDLSYIINFACCASVLKHTVHGDANAFTVAEIEEFMEHGVARIQR